MKTKEKNKYFIYNEDYKILIFTKMNGDKIEIFIPDDKIHGYDYEENKEFNKAINKLLNYNDVCYLGTNVNESTVFDSENYKLRKVKLKIIRNYYSYYKEFNESEMNEITKLCYKNDISPYFVTIEELKEIIESMSFHSIDIKMLSSLNELDKRLKYIKY